MSSREEAQTGQKRGQRILHLLQDPEDADNLKELKGMLGNRSVNDFLVMMTDVYKVYQDVTDENVVLEEEQLSLRNIIAKSQEDNQTLKMKYQDLKERLRDQTNNENRLRKQIGDLQAKLQDRDLPGDPSPPQGTRYSSVETRASNVEGKRSPKYPDPPTLIDGTDPTFKEWETGLKNKFLFNEDWYEDASQTRVHAKQVAYIQTTVKGKAFEHLDSFLDQHEGSNEVVTADMCRKFLKQVFDDPDKRLKDRSELNKLRLKYLGNFNDFYSDFVRLANGSKKPRSDWKEDIHDKLYEQLQVHLEQYVMDDSFDFDAYCQKARHFARGEERIGTKRRELAARRKQQPASKDLSNKPKANIQQANNASATSSSGTPSEPLVCYGCGKKGHTRRNCPDADLAGDSKAIDLEESDEEFESQESEPENE